MNFCPGDTIFLYTEPRGASTHFIMWDFDPYYNQLARYIVPARSTTVTAYYGPDEYWYQHINTTTLAGAVYDDHSNYNERPAGAGYVTTYNGDVHIYDENGLAWLISVVNGLNGTQARPFFFNRVLLHQKRDGSDGYDMKDYLWTPVGTLQHYFRGFFYGVGSCDTCTIPLDGSRVVIKNIILNEPNMDNVGFFSSLDSARIMSIELQGVLARGSQYVGALAAQSQGSIVDNVAVTTSGLYDPNDPTSGERGESSTTILSTHYISGGLIGQSERDRIVNTKSWVKYVGDAVYSGGIVGKGYRDSIYNNGPLRNDYRMSGLYIGGIAGYCDGEAPVSTSTVRRLYGAKSSAGWPTHIANNYVYFVSDGNSARAGGLVGYAQNTVLENNYVYGEVKGMRGHGGVAAVMANNATADRNYYADGTADKDVTSASGNATLTNTASFTGSGNQVTLSDPVEGINNLTRVLNQFVREHNAQGAHYRTWRSTLDGTNGGYPVFGTPDLIPVVDSMTITGCDRVEFNGRIFTTEGHFTVHTVDTVEMVDSTMHYHIVVHQSALTQVADSVTLANNYDGYGFHVSSIETLLLANTLDSLGYGQLVLYDTLSTEQGCDSVVMLTLTITPRTLPEPIPVNDITPAKKMQYIKVYPNPTTSVVHVEAEGMSRVELYDNEGRRLAHYATPDGLHTTIDLEHYPSGIYYLRVHTSETVSIQKIIKK